MKIDQTASSTITELWAKVEPRVQQSKFLEEAAQALATAIHTHFNESVALARVFFTVPFPRLNSVNIHRGYYALYPSENIFPLPTSVDVLSLNELVSVGKFSAVTRVKASRQNKTTTSIWPPAYASPVPKTLFTL